MMLALQSWQIRREEKRFDCHAPARICSVSSLHWVGIVRCWEHQRDDVILLCEFKTTVQH